MKIDKNGWFSLGLGLLVAGVAFGLFFSRVAEQRRARGLSNLETREAGVGAPVPGARAPAEALDEES